MVFRAWLALHQLIFSFSQGEQLPGHVPGIMIFERVCAKFYLAAEKSIQQRSNAGVNVGGFVLMSVGFITCRFTGFAAEDAVRIGRIGHRFADVRKAYCSFQIR